jgi:glycosyl transferase, family 25
LPDAYGTTGQDMADIPTFILTVDAADGLRRRHAAKECRRLGLSHVFVEGVTGGSPEIRQAYSVWRNFLWMKRSLTVGEIACYIGHRRIWQAVLDSGHEVVLACEDDFQSIDDAAIAEILRLAPLREDWDILKLFDFSPKPVVNSRPLGSMRIVDYKYPAAGAVCYLIRRSAAASLLRRKSVFRPVDEDFLYCWEFGLRVRSVLPNPVVESAPSLGGSILEHERKSLKVRKNLARSLWGIVLTGVKQVRARRYLESLRRADRSRSQ